MGREGGGGGVSRGELAQVGSLELIARLAPTLQRHAEERENKEGEEIKTLRKEKGGRSCVPLLVELCKT